MRAVGGAYGMWKIEKSRGVRQRWLTPNSLEEGQEEEFYKH